MYIYSVRSAIVWSPCDSKKREPVIGDDRVTLIIFFFPVIVILSLPRPLCKLNRHYSRPSYLATYRWERPLKNLHVASRSLAKFSAGFPPKMIPATYRIRQEPRGNGCSGKVREMACRVIRGRGGGVCQLFPCCHLQWPVQSEGGTDLRVSRIIITQAERHAARRFMGHIMARHLNDYLLLNVNGL